MKREHRRRLLSLILTAVMLLPLLSGCGGTSGKTVDADTITVYLWSSALYNSYAPYVQSQLPDVNIQFVVGNNDLDFYKFMDENGGLPDIITCCRFSLHDASPLKGSLMDLSTTAEAGAVYETYLQNFMNEDGSVNWLPVCADAHGFIVNRALFEKYDIPLPTDYDSFVSACKAFEEVGIRGFTADFAYDYTCMETLQGLSVPELISNEGRSWRTAYSDPASSERVGLDDAVWPGVFERMEQFIQDTNLRPDDLNRDYGSVVRMYQKGELAMFFGSSARVLEFLDQGIDTVFLPFFGSNGEPWLMTTPYFQVALNGDLAQDTARRETAMQVLNVMLSEEAQNLVANGQDILNYSQNVSLRLSDHLKDVRSVVEQNHMYIRIASNDFFAISKDVVSKMITGEYSAQQAYEAFDTQLRQPQDVSVQTVLTSEKAYSNIFRSNGGNEAYSVMANSLRVCYGSDVLIAPADSFTGSVLKAEYTEKQVGSMIMPNALLAFHREMTGAELKETAKAYVEGIEGGFRPFNRGSLPTFSGICAEVKEENGSFTLIRILYDGKEVADTDTFRVTCLNTDSHMAPFLKDEGRVFERGDETVKQEWTACILGGGTLAEPESYIKLR